MNKRVEEKKGEESSTIIVYIYGLVLSMGEDFVSNGIEGGKKW